VTQSRAESQGADGATPGAIMDALDHVERCERVTLCERVDELVREHGSLRAAARAVKIDHGYLQRLRDGEKKNPGRLTLRRLGLRKVIAYERTRS
jgi:hypothetical protein